MNLRYLVLASVVTCVMVTGCETYMEAKQNVAPGGKLEQERAQARQTLVGVQKERVQLQDAKLQRERELERNQRRIQALEADLRQQDAALSSALRDRKVTKENHARLKRDMDAIRKETQAIGLQNDSDRLATGLDPKADAAKEARLRDLERRKKELETALATLVKR